MEVFSKSGKLVLSMLRIAVIFLFCLVNSPALRAADIESDQFRAAEKALSDRFYERAEQQFGEF